MKKLLLALALFLVPAAASAQCTGVFPASTVCGSAAGGVAGPVPFASLPGFGVASVTAANGTLTISPTIGAVIAGLNLSNSNTWLATQIFPANSLTLGELPQGVANSIWINPTGSTANMTNVAVPACANDGAHGLVYINGTGLQCASVGTVTSAVIAGGTGMTATGTCTITTTGTCTVNQSLTNAVIQTGSLTPAGTTSATGVMMGIGSTFKLTPVYSTRIRIECTGTIGVSASGSGSYSLRFGTGVAPTNGAAPSGSVVSNANFAFTGTTTYPFAISGILTGLTPGTAYWFDEALNNNGGVITVTFTVEFCNAMEF